LPDSGAAAHFGLTHYQHGFSRKKSIIVFEILFSLFSGLIQTHRLGSGQWKLARFYVSDARFANRENNGADLRFYNAGDDLLISAVQIKRFGP
jgi:hypothetical protein